MNDNAIGDAYHRWCYDTGVWMRTSFLGIPCLKSVSDMWNYQEIIVALRPAFVVGFGTYSGGSALFFALIRS
jgi:cephalosporin hydroxylase